MPQRQERKDGESWIDEQIRRAQEQGQFDGLPGKGKALDLTPNPHAGDWEMAFKMLRDAGYAPEWIELDKAIRARLERARLALARSWQWYQGSAPEPGSVPDVPPPPNPSLGARSGGRHGSADSWQDMAAWQVAVAAFRDEVAAINLEIAALNLQVPSPSFQRMKVDPDREVRCVQEGVA